MDISPEDFVQKLTFAYENGYGIFNNRINAEELVPTHANNLQKALYLFYVLQLDYATKSQNLYTNAQRLFNKDSDFFTPTHVLEIKEIDLLNTLKKDLRPRYINEAVKRYIFNSHMLKDKYNSDPRNIFINATSAKEIIQRIRQFRGFGPKIGNFFIRCMINTFEYEYKDIDEISPPIDVHDVNVTYLLGYIKNKDMTKKNINEVKSIWKKACISTGKSWLLFDKALWLLGSEGKPKTKEDVLSLVSLSRY